MKIKKIIVLLMSAVMVSVFSGCDTNKTAGETSLLSINEEQYNDDGEIPVCTKELFAMDTYMTVTAYGKNAEKAVSDALDEIRRLDDLLSAENENSEIYLLNKNGSGKLSDDSKYLFDKAKYIYETTEGAYDITVYPLMKLWGFAGGEPSLPDDKSIKETVSNIGMDKLKYENSTLTLGKNQGIDLGGIAKGYASQRIMTIFEQNDIISGVVSLGGNVQCYKTKTDGSLWRCGITDPNSPEDTSSLIGKAEVSDKAVITSGGYERFFTDEKTQKTYHHIMNPKTGYSVDNGVISVTIVSADGTLADGLSTACFVMGEKKALDYWKQHSSEFDMVLVTDDGRIIVTEGIGETFSSDREFTVYKK